MIGTKLASFEVTKLLGKGGMGEVWLARDTKLDRDVAIKTLPAHLATDPERLSPRAVGVVATRSAQHGK